MHFESDSSIELEFVLRNETASLGSRLAGKPVRHKLLNLSKMIHDRKITIDFSDINLVSSSFADEVIGKLFVEMGTIEFMRRFELRNMSPMGNYSGRLSTARPASAI